MGTLKIPVTQRDHIRVQRMLAPGERAGGAPAPGSLTAMDVRARIAGLIDVHAASGLEIGALHNPIKTKATVRLSCVT